MRRVRISIHLLVGALVAVLAAATPALGQAVVQRVDVAVVVDGPPPHPLVAARLQETVESVAVRLLLGRPVDQLLPQQRQLGETIGGVLDRVVAGYVTTSAAVQPGAAAAVRVTLRPVGAVVEQVGVVPDLEAVPTRVRPLVGAALQEATARIAGLYRGLPALAPPWAGPLLEADARAAVEAALPGYTAAIRVRADGAAQVALAIGPRDSRVIRNIGVRFRSTSIPTLLLEPHAPQVASMAEPLRGVPVLFAERHRRALAALIAADLAAYPPVRQYHIVATAALDVGETTYVTVLADSVLYRGRVEAQLNIGMGAPGPAVVGRVGRLVTRDLEAFVELRLVPNTLSMEWDLGGQVALSPSTWVGAAYTLGSGRVTALATAQLGRDVGLRGAWNLTDQTFTGALVYRLNEFLSGELVATWRGEVWLRLVSNL